MEKSQSIKELATALCKFQGSVEKIKKTATNPFFKSKYANLADILDVIREPLFEAGLSFVQFPKGKHELETMLMHVSGEWMSDTYEMTPIKNDPQGLGSVITYQRRYALGAVLGLNIDEDDDGKTQPITKRSAISLPELTPEVVEDWQKAIIYLQGTGTIDKLKTKRSISATNEQLLKDAVL